MFCGRLQSTASSFRGRKQAPTGLGEIRGLNAYLSSLKFTVNQRRAFDNQLKWPLKLLGSSRRVASLGRSKESCNPCTQRGPLMPLVVSGTYPGSNRSWLSRARVALGTSLSLSEPPFLLVSIWNNYTNTGRFGGLTTEHVEPCTRSVQTLAQCYYFVILIIVSMQTFSFPCLVLTGALAHC